MKSVLPLVALSAILALSLAAVTLVIQRSPALEATHAMPCADLTGNSVVNVFDIITEVTYFGYSVPPAPAQADMNGDTRVSWTDVEYVVNHFGLPTGGCQDTPIGPNPNPQINPAQVLGALGVSGDTATLQAGRLVRWICDPNDSVTSVQIHLSYDWGSQDINGTGRTTLTHVLPPNLLNSQCIFNGLYYLSFGGLSGALSVDSFEPANPSGVVLDSTSHLPVLGATVMLQIEDSPSHYRDVDPIADAALIEPDINPETTGLDGSYAWTVGAGNYRVVMNPGISGSGESLIAGSAAALCAAAPPVDLGDPTVYIDCFNHDSDALPDYAEVITTTSPGVVGSDDDMAAADSNVTGLDVNGLPFPSLAGNGVADDLEDPDGDGYNNYQEIQLGRNPLVSENADSDGDGCPNGKELQTAAGSQTSGGRRDPSNPYDYFNTYGNPHWIRIDDILAVVHQFFIDSGNPAYNPDTDRTYVGPNPWNLGPPNGQQRVDDILHSVHQFFHDCS